jgi:hypothetical protein
MKDLEGFDDPEEYLSTHLGSTADDAESVFFEFDAFPRQWGETVGNLFFWEPVVNATESVLDYEADESVIATDFQPPDPDYDDDSDYDDSDYDDEEDEEY